MPYAPGEPWPERADMCLDAGVDEDAVDIWVQAASTLHSNGDGIDIAVKDGRMVGVRGRANDRVNGGRLDPKDCYGWRALHSPDRLTRPLVRAGGKLVETDWHTAMGRIVERSRSLLKRSTTRSRSSARPASARRTWTATRGCVPPQPQRR
jgi:anaerobic selenocysteine-containing dehydrogenase